jgi:hypothetical protein
MHEYAQATLIVLVMPGTVATLASAQQSFSCNTRRAVSPRANFTR